MSVLIIPLRYRFSTSSALDVPELRHAMLVIACVLCVLETLVGDEDGDSCLVVGLVAVSRRENGLFDEKNRATVDCDDGMRGSCSVGTNETGGLMGCWVVGCFWRAGGSPPGGNLWKAGAIDESVELKMRGRRHNRW